MQGRGGSLPFVSQNTVKCKGGGASSNAPGETLKGRGAAEEEGTLLSRADKGRVVERWERVPCSVGWSFQSRGERMRTGERLRSGARLRSGRHKTPIGETGTG